MSCQWHTDRSWFVDSKSSLATQGESEESVKSAVMTQWQINYVPVSDQRFESGILQSGKATFKYVLCTLPHCVYVFTACVFPSLVSKLLWIHSADKKQSKLGPPSYRRDLFLYKSNKTLTPKSKCHNFVQERCVYMCRENRAQPGVRCPEACDKGPLNAVCV